MLETNRKIRFWKSVDKKGENECWNWKSSKNKKGYGRIHLGMVGTTAHRFSYMINKGEIPEGMFVCHSCDNPGCVNPNHLFLGTNKDNMKDCMDKNRVAWGERTKHSKLNNEQVLEIIDLYKTNRYTEKELGLMFGVSFSNIYQIIEGKTWRRLTGGYDTRVINSRKCLTIK